MYRATVAYLGLGLRGVSNYYSTYVHGIFARRGLLGTLCVVGYVVILFKGVAHRARGVPGNVPPAGGVPGFRLLVASVFAFDVPAGTAHVFLVPPARESAEDAVPASFRISFFRICLS